MSLHIVLYLMKIGIIIRKWVVIAYCDFWDGNFVLISGLEKLVWAVYKAEFG